MNTFTYTANPVVRISVGRSQHAGPANPDDETFVARFTGFLQKAHIHTVGLPVLTPVNGGTFSGYFTAKDAIKVVEWLESQGVQPMSTMSLDLQIKQQSSALARLRRLAGE